MPRSNGTDKRSNQVIGEAGVIMRKLSLPPIITLHHIHNNNKTYTQKEIADVIGCERATVSQYLRSMKELPLPLVVKQGQRYTTTEAGEAVLSHLKRMFDRLGDNINTIDWKNEAATEEIAAWLTPFGNARSTPPFLLLYSIGTRSAFGERIERHGTPRPASLEDVVQDVTSRQEERGGRSTRKQVQELLRRFDDAGTVEYDGQEITLTKKGHEQANFLEQLIQILEKESEIGDNGEAGERVGPPQSSPADSSYADRGNTQMSPERSSRERYEMDNIAQQTDPRGFFDSGRASIDILEEADHEVPAIIPAYCLRAIVDDESEPTPVYPFTTLSLNELADQIRQLAGEYDGEIKFEPYWTLQTKDGLYPLSQARLPLGEASRRAWKLVNDAHELWNEQSQ